MAALTTEEKVLEVQSAIGDLQNLLGLAKSQVAKQVLAAKLDELRDIERTLLETKFAQDELKSLKTQIAAEQSRLENLRDSETLPSNDETKQENQETNETTEHSTQTAELAHTDVSTSTTDLSAEHSTLGDEDGMPPLETEVLGDGRTQIQQENIDQLLKDTDESINNRKIEEDIERLKHLLRADSQNKNQSYSSIQIEDLGSEEKHHGSFQRTSHLEQAPISLGKGSVKTEVQWTALSNYYWDQTKKNGVDQVRVHIKSDHTKGLTKSDQQKVRCDFNSRSFDLKLQDFNGKHFRLVVENLEGEIEPSQSSVKVRRDKIVVTLVKVHEDFPKHWNKLIDPNSKRKEAEKENPAASIMNMMKDMYESGDEKTKEMIGKAMLESRQKQMEEGNMPAW